MTKNNDAVAALIEPFRGHEMDAHYLGYFGCFNRQLYFEAHDVLEKLWLAQRHGPNHSFYKGLIQLAGAFVHLQRNRLRPAAALFKLADSNLAKYPPTHEKLDIRQARKLIQHWLTRLEAGQFQANPLHAAGTPVLQLQP